MEKGTPHYPLDRVKELLRLGAYTVTRTALRSAVDDFGCGGAREIVDSVLALESRRFYKSMTTYWDHSVWQDVYHGEVRGMAAYIKIQIVDNSTIVISFKRLEDES